MHKWNVFKKQKHKSIYTYEYIKHCSKHTSENVFHIHVRPLFHLKSENFAVHQPYNYSVQVYLNRFDSKKGGPKEDQLYV